MLVILFVNLKFESVNNLTTLGVSLFYPQYNSSLNEMEVKFTHETHGIFIQLQKAKISSNIFIINTRRFIGMDETWPQIQALP